MHRKRQRQRIGITVNGRIHCRRVIAIFGAIDIDREGDRDVVPINAERKMLLPALGPPYDVIDRRGIRHRKTGDCNFGIRHADR